MKNKDYATFGVGGKKGVLWKMCKWRIDKSFPLSLVTAPEVLTGHSLLLFFIVANGSPVKLCKQNMIPTNRTNCLKS